MLQEVANVVRSYLSSRSLAYVNGPIIRDPGDSFRDTYNRDMLAFLESHVEEIRLCDAELDTSVPIGTKLMAWQVMHAFTNGHRANLDFTCGQNLHAGYVVQVTATGRRVPEQASCHGMMLHTNLQRLSLLWCRWP